MELGQLTENVDAWVRQINKRVSELEKLPPIVEENTNNIEHDYELIYELRNRIHHIEKQVNYLNSQLKILLLKDEIARLRHEIGEINLMISRCILDIQTIAIAKEKEVLG